MSDDLSSTWKSTVSTFWGYVHDLNESPHADMSAHQSVQLKAVEAGLYAFIASFGTDFNAACTRPNLLFLSNSWATFIRCSRETNAEWRARFPEWAYMFTQFHAFVNERAIADMAAAHAQPHPNWYDDTASHRASPRTVHAALLHSLLRDLKHSDIQKPREQ